MAQYQKEPIQKSPSKMVQTGERKNEEENIKAAVSGKDIAKDEENEQDEDNLYKGEEHGTKK